MASAGNKNVVVIAVDNSIQAEDAFNCKYSLFIIHSTDKELGYLYIYSHYTLYAGTSINRLTVYLFYISWNVYKLFMYQCILAVLGTYLMMK